jgi:hypothetical protein
VEMLSLNGMLLSKGTMLFLTLKKEKRKKKKRIA